MKRKGFAALLFIMITMIFCINVFAATGLNKKRITLYVGKKYELILNGANTNRITWKSTKSSCANIKVGKNKSKATVTAKKAGTATVRATAGGKNYDCQVTVKDYALSSKNISLYTGKSAKLSLTGATGADSVTWSSGNRKTATVDRTGKVTAVKKGSTNITARINGKSYKCKVVVKETPVSISETNITLYSGWKKTLALKGEVKREKITWKTSKSRVATVNQSGIVQGFYPGNAVITATYQGKRYKCNVTVIEPSSKLSAHSLAVEKGKTRKITLSGISSGQKIKWKSSNTGIATVSAGTVKGINTGSAVITAQIPGETYQYNIKVTEPALHLNTNEVEIDINKTYQLALIGMGNGTITWTTKNTHIATVTGRGLVRGISPGTVLITAKYLGRIYACNVTVTDPNLGMSAEEKRVYNILMSFKSKYPEGTKFTNNDYRPFNGGLFSGGFGCAAFAFELSDAAFGKAPARRIVKNEDPNLPETIRKTSEITTKPLSELKIRSGDILRTDNNAHCVIVLKVSYSEKYYIVAEGNYGKVVHWGRKIPFSEFDRTGSYIITRYES